MIKIIILIVIILIIIIIITFIILNNDLEGHEGLRDPTILDKIKWNRKNPHPPKSRMKPREGQKRAIFPSLIWGGGEGDLGFPFILSKIVACSRLRDSRAR